MASGLLTAKFKETIRVVSRHNDGRQMRGVNLFFTAARTGDIAINNLVVAESVYYVSLDFSMLILPLSQLIRQLALLHITRPLVNRSFPYCIYGKEAECYRLCLPHHAIKALRGLCKCIHPNHSERTCRRTAPAHSTSLVWLSHQRQTYSWRERSCPRCESAMDTSNRTDGLRRSYEFAASVLIPLFCAASLITISSMAVLSTPLACAIRLSKSLAVSLSLNCVGVFIRQIYCIVFTLSIRLINYINTKINSYFLAVRAYHALTGEINPVEKPRLTAAALCGAACGGFSFGQSLIAAVPVY